MCHVLSWQLDGDDISMGALYKASEFGLRPRPLWEGGLDQLRQVCGGDCFNDSSPWNSRELSQGSFIAVDGMGEGSGHGHGFTPFGGLGREAAGLAAVEA